MREFLPNGPLPIRPRSIVTRRSSPLSSTRAPASMRLSFQIPRRPMAATVTPTQDSFPFFPQLNVANETVFSHWNYGTRSETLHLSSSLSPTWQLDISGTAKRSHFNEVECTTLQIIDDSGHRAAWCVLRSRSAVYAKPVDSRLWFRYRYGENRQLPWAAHVFLGWGFTHSIYALDKAYSGGYFAFPSENIAGIPLPNLGSPALVGAPTNAAFLLRSR